MALLDIINTVSERLGYDVDEQRSLLVRVINRAAKEIYELVDLPGCLREATLIVPPDSVVALPSFVGELRNMRNAYCYDRIPLKELMPKYSYQPWPEIWQNWRLIGKSPIKASIVNAGVPIVVSRENAEAAEVVVTITGRTAETNRTRDIITFGVSDLTQDCQKPFIEIHSITKSAVNEQDLTFTSKTVAGADLIIAVLPNDQLESSYNLVDVSQLPSDGQNSTPNRYVDVLFKAVLNRLDADGDTFPCEGFDDAIAYKVLEHEFSLKPDGIGLAIGWNQKCNMIIKQRMEHVNVSQEKQSVFASNPLLGLHPRRSSRLIIS